MLDIKRIHEILKLEPLPVEGGYFAETYRSKIALAPPTLPSGYSGMRALCAAIYYLLTPESFSAMHRLKGDEIFHFYLGDPVEMLLLKPDGSAEALLLGQEIDRRMRLQQVVPGGVWQGLRVAAGGRFALLGTTMAPGFDPADFEVGDRAKLSAQYPSYEGFIEELTR